MTNTLEKEGPKYQKLATESQMNKQKEILVFKVGAPPKNLSKSGKS